MLWVEREGRRLSGMVFEHKRAQSDLQLWAIGATNGDPALLKEGAIHADPTHMDDALEPRTWRQTCDVLTCGR